MKAWEFSTHGLCETKCNVCLARIEESFLCKILTYDDPQHALFLFTFVIYVEFHSHGHRLLMVQKRFHYLLFLFIKINFKPFSCMPSSPAAAASAIKANALKYSLSLTLFHCTVVRIETKCTHTCTHIY